MYAITAADVLNGRKPLIAGGGRYGNGDIILLQCFLQLIPDITEYYGILRTIHKLLLKNLQKITVDIASLTIIDSKIIIEG
jgi:hypothetical protein